MKTLPWKKFAMITVAIGVVVAGIFYFNRTAGEGPANIGGTSKVHHLALHPSPGKHVLPLSMKAVRGLTGTFEILSQAGM